MFQMHLILLRIEMIKDLGYQMSFSVFDEASVSEWKGVDLRLANEIPNMDLVVLAVKRVSYCCCSDSVGRWWFTYGLSYASAILSVLEQSVFLFCVFHKTESPDGTERRVGLYFGNDALSRSLLEGILPASPCGAV